MDSRGEEILKTVEEALAASLQAEKESRELEQQVLARKTGLERRLEAARAGEKLRQQQIRAEGLLQALEAERGLQEERKRRLKQAVEALPLQAKEEEILANRSALAQSRKSAERLSGQLAALTERLAEADAQKKTAAEAFEREQPALLEQEARLREALPLYDSWEAVRRRLAQTEQAFRKTAETRKKTEEEKENSAAALALLKAEQEEKSRAPLLLQKSREKRKRTEEKLDRIRSLKARLENLKERQTALSEEQRLLQQETSRYEEISREYDERNRRFICSQAEFWL